MLTALSAFWFERTSDLVRNHLISDDPDDLPAQCDRRGRRSTAAGCWCDRAERIDIECVVRGYLAG